jgi:hypothetical protein
MLAGWDVGLADLEQDCSQGWPEGADAVCGGEVRPCCMGVG